MPRLSRIPTLSGPRVSCISVLGRGSVLCIAALLTGCGAGPIDTTATPLTQSMVITGRIHGGEQPISGATVQLWETGTSGYGLGATPLACTAISAIGTGTFTCTVPNLPADCINGPFAYITASGGDPTGQTLISQNHAILNVAILGTCSSVGATTSVDIDEVTTVAAAYALRSFAKVTGAPGTLATVSIGAPSTNAQGLADAVANATLLASAFYGVANTSTAGVQLPTATINSIANSVAACTNASEYNVSPCTILLPLATPPGGTEPSNLFQALLNIAQYPGQNVTAILHAASSFAPFGPTLPGADGSSVVNDLSLGITYLNSTLSGATTGPVGLAIDTTDNVWVLGASNGTSSSTYNYIAELPAAATGGSYTATLESGISTLSAKHTLRNGAFDTLGNFWLSDKSSNAGLIEIPHGSSASAATEITFTSLSSGGLDANDWTVAIDTSGDPWTVSYGGQGNCSTTASSGHLCDYVEFAKSGSTYTPTDLFGSATQPSPTVRGIAADTVSTSLGLGSIWTANYGTFSGINNDPGTSVEVLKPSTGALSTITLGSTADSPYGIALDTVGGAFVTTSATNATSALYYVPQATANSATISSTVSTSGTGSLTGIGNTTTAPASSESTAVALGGFNNPGYLALDGAGNVFVANQNYGTIVEYSPSLSAFVSPFYGFAPSIGTVALPTNEALFTCTDTSGTTTCAIAGLTNKKSLIPLAIDRAGSVWSMDSDGTLLEIIGTAAPTNPVLAAGQTGSLP